MVPTENYADWNKEITRLDFELRTGDAKKDFKNQYVAILF